MYRSKLKSGIVGLRKSTKGVQRVDLANATQEELKILFETGHEFIKKIKDVQAKQKDKSD
jgi:hypothetical protein